MFVKKGNNPRSVSQFNLNERVNGVDLLMSQHRGSAQSQAQQSQNNNYTDLFQLATDVITSKQYQNQNHFQNEPNFMHRESRGGIEFHKKKSNLNLNGITKIHSNIEQGDQQMKDFLFHFKKVSDRVDKLQTIFNEIRHDQEETNKSTSQQFHKFQKQTTHVKTSIDKIFEKVKGKFRQHDTLIQNIRVDLDGVINKNSCVNNQQSKQRSSEIGIVYGLDVKSSIEGIKYHPESDPTEQMKQLNIQIETLRQQINSINKSSIGQDINKINYQQLRSEFQSMSTILSSRSEEKLKECERVLKDHDQNIQKMNQQFQKVINEQISPRILSMQDNIRLIPQTMARQDSYKKMIDELSFLRSDLQQKLKNSQVLQVRKQNIKEKDIIKKSQGININETYYLDEQKYLLDNKGIYIVDESNNKIKIQEQYVYFMNLHGINIMNIQ